MLKDKKKPVIFMVLALLSCILAVGAVSAADTPSANFTTNTTNGFAPLSVQFNDTSTGSPTSWNWDFGDGSTSAEQNPTHTYNAVGAYTVKLNVANELGSSNLTQENYITAWNTSSVLVSNNGITFYVANDAGVKYDIPNGVNQQGNYKTIYVPNSYYIAKGGGGLNPVQLSTDPTIKSGQLTTTTNQSGTFWIVFSGGIGHLDNAILMLAVNGTIPDDFALHITSSGYNYTIPSPALSNPATSTLTNVTWVEGAVNETFYKSDFIYGPQSWKPANTVGYSIFKGQDPSNNFSLMFIDLYASGFCTNAYAGVTNGSIRVDYSFENLESFAAFNAYGWFSACNWGTGIPMTSNILQSAFNVIGVPATNFTSNTTNGSAPLTVQFTDTSSNGATSWSWDFGDGNTSTEQNQSHTYSTAGTYTVSLTASNLSGPNILTKTDYITVLASDVYVTVTPSNNAPVVGDTVKYTFKLGNHGPGTAYNVVFTYVIPEGMEYVGVDKDVGNVTYDSTTRTITWTISELPEGDPYLWLDLRILTAGNYLMQPTVTTSTYNPGLISSIGSLQVNAVTATTVNAASTTTVQAGTVPMQSTGAPLAGLILGILCVGSGLVMNRKK